MKHFLKSQKGSALLLVMGILGILTILATGIMELINNDSSFEIARNKSFQARLLAESGISIASNKSIQMNDDILYQKLDNGDQIYAVIQGEQGRMNINVMLQPANLHYLTDLFDLWKIPQDVYSDLIAKMQDWIDADELPRAGGAEHDDYIAAGLSYVPANRNFRSLDELDHVMGIEALAQYKPDWKDYFTVYGNTQLDINSAPLELIQVFTGADEMRAQALIDTRDTQNPDGSFYRYTSLEDVRSILGLSQAQFNTARSHLLLQSNYRRVSSTGYTGNFSITITAILRWNNSTPQYVEWQNTGVSSL